MFGRTRNLVALGAISIISTAVNADISKNFRAEVEYVPWLVEWDQKSTSSSRFGSNAIDVDYTIDPTLAHAYQLRLSAYGFHYVIKNFEAPDESSLGDKTLSYLSMGLNYLSDSNINYGYRLLQSSFEGLIDGTYRGKTGIGTFETDTVTHDIYVSFESGFGFGYRYFDYEVPQDVYVVHSSTPNTPIIQGFVDMHHQAHYLTGSYKNKDLFSTAKSSTMGISLDFSAGFGSMSPDGQGFVNETESMLRNNGTIGAGVEIIEDGDSWFYDIDINAYKNFKLGDRTSASLALGYRFNHLTTEFEAESEYSLVADFETTFSGPYLQAQARF